MIPRRSYMLRSYLRASAMDGGAWLLGHLGETKAAYHAIFTLSRLARATTLILQARVVAGNIRVPAPAEQTLAVRPALGSIEEPILSSLPGEAARERD